jgi:tetratricopeptide (TPR) repeat protein
MKGAVDFARQAIKLRPRSGGSHIVLARALLALGDVGASEQEVMGLATGSPASPDVQMLLGEYYWARKDSPRSRAAYEKALALRGDSVDALAGIVRTDLAQKNGAAAQARIAARLARTPTDQRLLLLAATTSLGTGDAVQAETQLRRLLQLNPSNLEAYVTLGSLYRAQNRLGEARKEFEEVARREPDMAVAATTMIATIMTLQGQKEEGLKAFEKVLTLDPDNAVAANNVAWHHAETGTNLDAALALAQTAKAKLPDRAEISDTLGYVLYKKGLHSSAVASLEEATRQAPTNAGMRYRLALAYLGNNDKERARSSFAQALQIDPTFSEAEDAKRQLASIK